MLHKIQSKNEKLIIIGSGPAGYTAAIYAARANLQPILITGLQKGGQLIQTNQIENWPGKFKKTTGIELMDSLEKHASKLHTTIISDQVLDIKIFKNIFQIQCEEKEYTSHSIIIATGSSPRYLGLENEQKFLGKGISTCATCDGFFYKNQDVAVVGGGNTAIEESLYLSNIVNVVHLVHRNKIFKAEKILINRLYEKIHSGNIVLHTDYIIKRIIVNHQRVVKIKLLSNNTTKNTKEIPISGLFIAIGSLPNTKIFKNIIEMKKGYIKTQKTIENYTTQTNVPGIFAAGDVVDYIYKQAITSAASGCMAALDAEKYLNTLNLQN
ncbi:thioredoxin-disulfide reductase [Buchnera aphidicola]|uniref:thioredoxin-disulfide reductase n=1 Tax=Buchnera aphidicola TaxID=9 RepID=UPI0034645448